MKFPALSELQGICYNVPVFNISKKSPISCRRRDELPESYLTEVAGGEKSESPTDTMQATAGMSDSAKREAVD